MAKSELGRRVTKLRGPDGGYSRSHIGLSAFWREVEEWVTFGEPHDGRNAERLAAPVGGAQDAGGEVSAEETTALTQLDAWFRDGPQNGVVLGADEAFRSHILGKWALSVAGDKNVFVVFLPISGRFSTRTERDALKLMMGLFPNSEAAQFTVPRTPLELKWATSLALGGRGVTAASAGDEGAGKEGTGGEESGEEEEEEEGEDPVVLLIVEGLDRLADAPPESLFPRLDEMGGETRVLVAAAGDRLPFGEGSIAERLSAESETLGVFVFPGEAQTGGEVGLTGLQRSCLNTLSVALAPLSMVDLGWLLELEAGFEGDLEAALSVLIRESRGDGRVLRRTVDGKVCFANEDSQRGFSAGVDEAVWEAKVVERALAALRKGEWETANEVNGGHGDAPGYVVEYLGAHLVRQGAGPLEVMELVTAAWFDAWKTMPGCLTGFLTDVRRAREVVHEALCAVRSGDLGVMPASTAESENQGAAGPNDGGVTPESATEGEKRRTALLYDFVRCVLVEAALFTREGSRTARRDRALPFVEPAFSTGTWPTRAADLKSVATLLRTLASVLNGDLKADAHSFAERACQMAELEGGAVLPIVIPATAGGVVCGIAPGDEFVEMGQNNPQEWMRRVVSSEGYGKILHLAQVLPFLPESLRESAAAEAASAYVDGEEDDALPLLLACGPWLPLDEAVSLLGFLGDRWSTTFSRTLLGPAGIGEMVPLFLRLGGEAAVFEVARATSEVADWLLWRT